MPVFWTAEKNDEFRKLRPTMPVAQLAEHFGTTVHAVRAHSLKLKIRFFDRNRWSADEFARLIELDDERLSVAEIGRRLGRTPGSIQAKLEDIGRKSNRMPDLKSVDEQLVAFAKNHSGPVPAGAVTGQALALKRSAAWVRQRLVKLGFTVEVRLELTDEQVLRLRALAADGHTLPEAAAELSWKLDDLRRRVVKLGISFRNARKATDEQEAGIKTRLAQPYSSLKQVASDLGLSPRKLKSASKELGIQPPARARRAGAPVSTAILEDLIAQGVSLTEAASRLNRDIRTLKALAAKLGVTFPAAIRQPKPAAVRKPRQDRITVPRSVEAVGQRKEASQAVHVRAQKPAKPVVAAAPKAAPKPRQAYVPRGLAVEKVKINLEPAPRREAVPVAPVKTSTFNRSAFIPAKRIVMDQGDVDEAVRRFIEQRGVTKIKASPADEAITSLRRLGFSVITKERGWVLDGRIRLETETELLDFANARRGRVETRMSV